MVKVLSRSAIVGDVRAAIQEWVDILCNQRFDEAAEWLASHDAKVFEPTEDFPIHIKTWSGTELRSIIGNYGVAGDLVGDANGNIHLPALLTPQLTATLESSLHVVYFYGDDDEFNDPEDAKLDPRIGDVHVNLPLVDGYGEAYLSDLTARFDLIKYDKADMIFSLLDIHVM